MYDFCCWSGGERPPSSHVDLIKDALAAYQEVIDYVQPTTATPRVQDRAGSVALTPPEVATVTIALRLAEDSPLAALTVGADDWTAIRALEHRLAEKEGSRNGSL